MNELIPQMIELPQLAFVMTGERWALAIVLPLLAAAVAAHFFRRDSGREMLAERIDDASTNASKRGFETIAELLKSEVYGNRAKAASARKKILEIMCNHELFDRELAPVFKAFLQRIAEEKKFSEAVREFLAKHLHDNPECVVEMKPAIAAMFGWAAENTEHSVWLAQTFAAAVRDKQEILTNDVMWQIGEAWINKVTTSEASCERLHKMVQQAEIKNCANLDPRRIKIRKHTDVQLTKPEVSTLATHILDTRSTEQNIRAEAQSRLYGTEASQTHHELTPRHPAEHIDPAHLQAAMQALERQRAQQPYLPPVAETESAAQQLAAQQSTAAGQQAKP